MSHSEPRRQFLRSALYGAAGAAAALALPGAQAAAPAAIAATPLSDTLTLFTGAGANVLALRDADGAALVDGGLAEHSGALLDAVRAHTGAPRIHTLFNTHWHPEQTGSNLALGRAGARILAHENTRLWLMYANPVPESTASYGPLPPAGRPTQTFFYGVQKAMLGEEPVEYGYLLQAHTDGDIYVYFRRANVLAAGCAAAGAGWPIIDYKTGGWIVGLERALKTMIAVTDEHTRIVPAHGPVLTRADLIEQQKMFGTISLRLQKMLRQGLGPNEAVAKAPTAEYDARWGDPRAFVTMAFKSLWGHFAPDA